VRIVSFAVPAEFAGSEPISPGP
jgi:hypothetical protein